MTDLPPRRQELLDWLREVAPPRAKVYEGALRILDEDGFPGRIHYIAHAVREIADGLVRALDPQQVGKRVQYDERTNEIARLWPEIESFVSDDPSPDAKIPIEYEAVAAVDALVNEHQARGTRASRFESLFAYFLRQQPLGSRDSKRAERLAREFKAIHEYFMGFVHIPESEPPNIDEEELKSRFEDFEARLHSFVGDFFTVASEIDQMLEAAQESQELDEGHVGMILPRLSSPQHEAYFFSQLDSPKWIRPLEKKGVFGDPPDSEDLEDGVVRFLWPPGRYLARMAEAAPEEVARIFKEMGTENPLVLGDMLDGAIKMPAEAAASLVPKVVKSAREGHLRKRPANFSRACELCEALTTAEEYGAALKLARSLFNPDEGGYEEPTERTEHTYKKSLRKIAPALAAVKPETFLLDLCYWLKRPVESHEFFDQESQDDRSYIWRPAIEEHDQNHDYDFASVLVGIVRESFERAIQNGNFTLRQALSVLDRFSLLVFGRLKLHLIGEFSETNGSLAQKKIMDRSLLEDRQYVHEYANLVRRRFDLLPSSDQKKWFEWVEKSPVPNASDEDEETTMKRKEWRIFERFHWVREYLRGDRAEFYDRMLSEHGEPDMVDLLARVGPVTRWGIEPSILLEDIEDLTFENVIEKLSHEPIKSARWESEGIGRTFGEYVAQDPEAFSKNARELIGQPKTLVRRFLGEMSEAANAGEELHLSPVLDLCQWVVEEAADPQDESGSAWQGTHDEICRLVENICKAKKEEEPRYEMSEDMRGRLWKILEPLTRRPAGSYIVQDSADDDPRVYDYFSHGLNSPRGKAVSAALEYARWVGKHLADDENVIQGGLDQMPEVRRMLEWQVAPENRSVTALSVIGARLGLIYWLDQSWLANQTRTLFNLEGLEQDPPDVEGWAAWNAFLGWVRPHIEFYRLFKPEFSYAAEQSGKIEVSGRKRPQPMLKLGEHLMLLYGRGQLGPDNRVLGQFIEGANRDVRLHSLGFVGRTLEGDEELPQEVIDRFMNLWESYWSGPGKTDFGDKPDTHAFGTWFASGRFPAEWALERLEEVTEVAPTPQPDRNVVQELAKICETDTLKAVNILDKMVRGDKEGWKIRMWIDPAKEVLKSALEDKGEARDKARKVIDYLGRRGFAEFGDLLGVD